MKIKSSPGIVPGIICILMLALSGTSAGFQIEVHGPVYTGEDLQDIISGDSIEMNADNFPGFFYDPEKNLSSERLLITPSGSGRSIDVGNLSYSSQVSGIKYAYQGYDWKEEQYPLLGFFGEAYVPLYSGDSVKLARLLSDSDRAYRLPAGEVIELGENFSLALKQVDWNSNSVRLELRDKKKIVAEKELALSEEVTWELRLNEVENGKEADSPVLRVHVAEAT